MNKYYKDGQLAPIECQQRIAFPKHYDRGAKRRFISAAKKGGLYYCHDAKSITLAFISEDEKNKSVQYYERFEIYRA